jgi:hypothetical protein
MLIELYCGITRVNSISEDGRSTKREKDRKQTGAMSMFLENIFIPAPSKKTKETVMV